MVEAGEGRRLGGPGVPHEHLVPKPQRYRMWYALVDPDLLTRDAGDVLYDIERAICDDDSEDHECPLMTMSSRGFTEEQPERTLDYAYIRDGTLLGRRNVFVRLVPPGTTMPANTTSVDHCDVDVDEHGHVIGITMTWEE